MNTAIFSLGEEQIIFKLLSHELILSDQQLRRLNEFYQVVFFIVLRIIREKMLYFDAEKSDLQLLIVPVFHSESGKFIPNVQVLEEYMK